MSEVTSEAIAAALHARDSSQSMTDEGLTRDMLEAAASWIVSAEHERCARLTRGESFHALLAAINRIAAQVNLPLDLAAELLTAINAYAQGAQSDGEQPERMTG